MVPRRDIIVALAGWLMRWVVVAVVASSTSACDTFDKVPPLASESAGFELVRPQSAPSTAVYRIGPGDDLLIGSFYHAELKQPVTVQSDGRVSVLLLGTVVAAGKTPQQLAEALTRGYRKFLDNADVTVTLSSSVALAVYVGGEVGKPSVVPIKGELSLLEGVTAAGGFNKTANKEQVLILRQTKDGHFQTFQVNANKVLHNEAPEIYLRQHDIVYVPQTAIAEVDQFVDQYINQIVPRSFNGVFGFQYNYALGGSSPVINPTTTVGGSGSSSVTTSTAEHLGQ